MDDGSPVACTPFVTYGGLMDILEKKAHSGNPRVFFFFPVVRIGFVTTYQHRTVVFTVTWQTKDKVLHKS